MKYRRLAFFDANDWIQEVQEEGNNLPESLLLVKYGKTSYTKAGERGEFEFTEADADKVISDFQSRGRDVVIDFEHQTLKGGKAPAAGWIHELVKTSEGLLAKIKYWTEEAAAHLKKGEYRYFSPTLYFSRSGRNVSAIHSVALTNHPAMHNVPALAADDGSAGEIEEMRRMTENINDTQHEDPMKQLSKLMELLSLSESEDYGNEAEQINAVSDAVMTLIEIRDKLNKFLEEHNFSDLESASGKIMEMVPKEEKIRLETELARKHAEQLVAESFADGKLPASKRAWAENFAMSDPDAFAEWSKEAPAVIPDNKETEESEIDRQDVEFTEKELEIFRLLGIDTNKLNKTKGA